MSDFSEFMNPPIEHNGEAYKQFDCKQECFWVHCPYCGKKLFPLQKDTEIKNLVLKCKNNKCHKKIIINV